MKKNKIVRKIEVKKIISWILTVILIVGIMDGLIFEKEVQAASNPYGKWQDTEYGDKGGDGIPEIRCTWFAWQCAYDRTGVVLPKFGNAGSWLKNAKNSGLSTGTVARANSIAVYNHNGSDWGHVAYVTSVSGNIMYVDEGGRKDLDHTSSQGVAYARRVPSNIGSAEWSGEKYNTLAGFIYLKDVPAPKPVIPNAPSNVNLNKNDIGLNDGLSVTWNASSGATSYDVNLVCITNSANNQSKSVGGTSASFSITKVGTYKINVRAKNSAGTSSATESANCVAHENVIVKYVDWNGDIIGKEQSVKWGGNASAPIALEREGYTFQNWSSDGKNIKSNVVIEAIYKINTYAVSFVDYNGDVIDKVQKVEWSSSAIEPTNIPTKKGYIFTGWDTSEYKCVKKALTVKATYVWENTNLPIITEIESAKRNEEATGYDIKVKLTNFPNDFTKGKLVFALITKEGKMVASEIKSISMPETKEISETATILYSGLVSRVQVSMIGVVDDETTGTPKAKAVTAPVDVGNKWSDWMTTVPIGDDIITESRDEYRYKDSKIIKSATQPTTPEGYNLISKNSTGTYTQWGSWSGWSDSPISGNILKDVGTQSVVASYVTQWNYKRWVSADGRTSGPTNGTWGGKACNIYQERGWGGELTCVGGQNSNQAGYFKLYGSAPCWYYPWTRQVAGSYKTQYRYRTRSEYYNYIYKQNEFSEWQPDKVETSDTREVEKRKAYRFKTNSTEVPCYNYKRYKYTNINNGKIVYSYTSIYADGMDYPGEWEYKTEFEELKKIAIVDDNIELYNGTGENSWYKADVNNEGTSTVFETKSSLEDQKGTHRKFEGKAEGAAGKVATLMVYKGQNTDPIASQIEYIGQVTIDEDGSYKFDYVTKEEPSVKTGDFVITLGIEGSTNYQIVGKIEAPKQVYTVDFVDNDGNSIGEQKKVVDGGTVDAPEVPEKEGMDFVGWDTGLKNIRENMVITAQYKKKKCTVIFVDWDKTSIEIKEFNYGDILSIDNIPEKAGQIFDKWVDEEKQEVKEVKSNMIVQASYKDTKYTVKFLDWNGDIISEQEISYGGEAKLPENPEAPNDISVFECWNRYEEAMYVTQDVALSPVAKYIKNTDKPIFTKQSGNYEGEQKVGIYSLSSNTDIYYTVLSGEWAEVACLNEGSFKKYDEPISVSQTSTILAYAVGREANSSELERVDIKINEETTTDSELTSKDTTTEVVTAQETTEKITNKDTTTEKITEKETTTQREELLPTKPSGLQAIVDKNNNYNIYWIAGNNVMYYQIYVNGENVGNTISTNYRIPASYFTNNGEYKIEVEAVNNIGASDRAVVIYKVENEEVSSDGITTGISNIQKETTENLATIRTENVEKSSTTMSQQAISKESTTSVSITTKESMNNVVIAKASIKKIINKGKKKIFVNWKAQRGVDGYQIQYSTNKKFTKKLKNKNVKGFVKEKMTIKGLKKKKLYYVRVRAYKKNGNETVYGPWSKIKKIKINK